MNLVLPTEAFASHLAIVGKTGSGKTYAAKGFVERLLDLGRRVAIVDPTGSWWGLRALDDGKRAGYPTVVFGGDHADVPIAETSGQPLAGLIASGNFPCVIDLSEMLLGSRHRFMTDFAEALHRLNKQPLHLVIDEADEFAPQNPLPETKRMLHQIDRIVRRGRIRGFRVIFITQRPAVLHKNILTQANTLIALRLTSPQDRKAVEAWIMGQGDIQAGQEVLNTLARLQRGEGWVWSPELDILSRARFPKIKTFDSSRAPEDGEKIAEPAKLADVDLSAVRASLADAEREAAANDPRRLRARIAELERASRNKPSEKIIDESAIAAAFQRGHADGWKARGQALAVGLEKLTAAAKELGGQSYRPAAAHASVPAPVVRPAVQTRLPARTTNGTGERLPSGERKILTALAQYPNGRTKSQVAILAGYAVTGGAFNNYLSALRTNGRIIGSGERLRVTDGGLQTLGDFEPLPTGADLLDHWLAQLGKAPRAALHAIASAYPRSLSKEEVAAAAGYEASGGAFNNALSRLRTLELIEGRGELRASEALFE